MTSPARYGGLAWRRRWWGVAAAWLICLAGWAGVAMLPNQYEASARVYIDADAVLTPLLRGIASDSSLTDQIDLLQRMLLSRPNLEKIIAKTDLQLDANSPARVQDAVEQLSRSIKVVAQTRSIFSIAYRNKDRQLAFDVVQAVLASFIENKAGDNRDEMERASSFLDSQIASYEKQLRDAEAKRAEFRSEIYRPASRRRWREPARAGTPAGYPLSRDSSQTPIRGASCWPTSWRVHRLW